ncbi:unnamed protein product [Symbiodinium natans]|uniref:Ubiquitin-like domain-containing protein n=1 Tax=Symbiodinium natans TaxID=878477 RepID=A0A812PLH8_9DINO|nr:unnamed protein product [Symbiodinium natans]
MAMLNSRKHDYKRLGDATIAFRKPDGAEIYVAYRSGALVADIKQKVSHEQEIPANRQVWLLGREELEDHMTLSGCGHLELDLILAPQARYSEVELDLTRLPGPDVPHELRQHISTGEWLQVFGGLPCGFWEWRSWSPELNLSYSFEYCEERMLPYLGVVVLLVLLVCLAANALACYHIWQTDMEGKADLIVLSVLAFPFAFLVLLAVIRWSCYAVVIACCHVSLGIYRVYVKIRGLVVCNTLLGNAGGAGFVKGHVFFFPPRFTASGAWPTTVVMRYYMNPKP